MIEEKIPLSTDRPVLDQIIKAHNLTYKELANKLELTDRSLRKFRSGTLNLKLSMTQIKTLSELLKPFDIRIEDLPNDWILENKKKT
jgi:hypothetical protein